MRAKNTNSLHGKGGKAIARGGFFDVRDLQPLPLRGNRTSCQRVKRTSKGREFKAVGGGAKLNQFRKRVIIYAGFCCV